MSPRHAVLARWIIVAAGLTFVGCGTDAVGTDACRRIEQARCRKAPACPTLGVSHVEACVAYARDQCLHGLPVPEPQPSRLDACVNAIEQATSCAIVEAPEGDPACAFLLIGSLPLDAASEDAAAPPSASDATSSEETPPPGATDATSASEASSDGALDAAIENAAPDGATGGG